MENNNPIYDKLLKFQKEMLTVKQDASNPFFKSKYSTLETILETVLPSLNKLELVVTHSLSDRNVTTNIIDSSSGESISSSFPVFGEKPQEVGSSITYARRYNLGALLNLNIDKDDDGNSANNAKPTYKKPVTDEFPPSEEYSDTHMYDELTGQPAVKPTVETEYGNCEKCGAEKVKNPKTNKVFCSAKCWLTK